MLLLGLVVLTDVLPSLQLLIIIGVVTGIKSPFVLGLGGIEALLCSLGVIILRVHLLDLFKLLAQIVQFKVTGFEIES